MIKHLLVSAVSLAMTAMIAEAQPPGNTEVKISSSQITGALIAASDTVLYVGFGMSLVKFPFQFINRDTTRYSVTNAIVVWSPEDLNWSHSSSNGGNFHFTTPVSGLWLDTTGYCSISGFDSEFEFSCLSCDGLGRDTLVFTATALDPASAALRARDSGIAFKIVVRLNSADSCKRICFDSAMSAPLSGWKWSSVNYQPPYEAIPSWSGARCFQIRRIINERGYPANACCVGKTGNVDCDPDNRTDISDLVRLIDYAYISFNPLCCYPAANISGEEGGQIDIGDVSYLLNYLYIDFQDWWLAPCGGWACNR